MMRRLSSILFADIAGYTALMQEDEDKARVVLQKFRDSLHENVPRYSGEIIQFYGDGVLVLFKSSVEAMNCAIKLQQEFLDTPKVPVRMGLHSGDVVFEDDNVFGNSVNEASRIESLGIPNSILFSERIKNDIKNHSEFSFVSLGEFEFKSLDRPMEVFALTGQKLAVPEKGNIDGKLKKTSKGSAISVYTWLVPILILAGLIAWWNGAFSSTGSEVTESKFTKVAVLPFEINGSSELDYLGEGLMDLLSNKINLIEGMVSVDPKISNAIFERSGRQYAEAIGMPDWDTQQTKYLVTGSLVQLGDSYTLLGSVKNNKGKEIASVEEAIVTKDSLFPHVNSFFKKIVSEIFQNKEIDFNSYALQSTENYDALNDFLKAEQARRQGKWELAHNFYKAATKKDSTFALAWLRWSNNIGFYDPDRGGPASERHIKRMLDKYKGKLPPIFQNYVEAWNLSTSGKIKEAI
jgi:class 3 adenylate cyclase